MAILRRLDTGFLLVLFLIAVLFARAQGGEVGIMKMTGSGRKGLEEAAYNYNSGKSDSGGIIIMIKKIKKGVVSKNQAGLPCTQYMCEQEQEASNEDVPCWCCGPVLAFGTCSFDQALCHKCN